MEFSANLFERRITRLLPPWAGGTIDGSGYSAQAPNHLTIDVSDLCSIAEDRRFIEEAYSRILGRGCDLVSLANCLEMLDDHIPRRVILLQLINSDEAKRRGLSFTGIPHIAVPHQSHQSILAPFNRLKQRVSARLFGLARRIILARFDAINHKINFLLRTIETRTDGLSVKTDQGLVALSLKIDQGLVALSLKMDQGLVALSEKLDANFHALNVLANDGPPKLDALSERVDVNFLDAAANFSNLQEHVSALRERLAGLATAIGSVEALFTKELSTVQNGITHNQSQLAGLEERHQELLKGLGELGNSIARNAPVDRKTPVVLSGGNNILATEVDGFIVGLPGEEWRLAAHYAFRGVLEPGLTSQFRSLVKPGMVVVDVGANIGIHTLDAARLLDGRGRVHSFEPAPRTFEILRDNVQVNGFLETNTVMLHEVAVTDKEGQAELSIFPADCGHNTLFADSASSSRITVKTVSLDQVLCHESRIDIVKIDAEGAEPLILQGMKSIITRNPGIQILLEFAPSHLLRAGFQPKDFLQQIHAMNLCIFRIDDKTGELSEVSCDQLVGAFSVNLYLAPALPSKETLT